MFELQGALPKPVASSEPSPSVDLAVVFMANYDGPLGAFLSHEKVTRALKKVLEANRTAEIAAKQIADRAVSREQVELSYGEHCRLDHIDLLEYEYGTRSGVGGPPRYLEGSLDNSSYLVQTVRVNEGNPDHVRDLLLRFPSLVGVWKKKGDQNWRGEFQGTTDEELDRWLPLRRG